MLYVGQNILVAKKSDNKRKKWYNATVVDIYDNEVLVSLPKAEKNVIRLEDGGMLEVSFVDGMVRYLFESSLRGKFGRQALAIDLPRQFEKVDLRQYPRAPAEMEIFYTEAFSGDAHRQYKKGYLVDISGNGMKFSTDQIYSPGTLMSVKFSLPGEDICTPIQVEGRVVRVIVNDRKDPTEYQMGLAYSGMEKKDRDLIVRYVNAVNARLERSGGRKKG
ncbi:MAG: flagellar brake protein [Peptococcaceae bacterium]|nr:flagellar brake protein [Peptococcaceae bacterium]